TKATNWVLLDARGTLLGLAPPDQNNLLGKSFVYRDYFHGGGDRLPTDLTPRQPIRAPHRSNVFASAEDGTLMVAFSVPVRDGQTRSGWRRRPRVVGVVVM